MKIIDIALKDLSRSYRSAFAIGMTIVAPLLLVGLISFAFGGAFSGSSDIPAVSVGVLNQDHLMDTSVLDQSLGENIRSMFFDESVQSWLVARDFKDEASLRTALDNREIGVAVIIPAQFSQDLLTGNKDKQVLIISDPTLSITPQVIENMVASMLDAVAGGGVAVEVFQERLAANGIQPDPNLITSLIERYGAWYQDFQRNLFHHPDQAALAMVTTTAETGNSNPLFQMVGIMMAGQMIFFAFFTGGYAMMSILQENEEGTLARMFTLPLKRTTILTGKLLAVILIVMVQGIVMVIAGHYIFRIQWGNPWMVILALAGQVLAASGLGVFLISFVKTSKQAGPILGGALTALGMLGGLFTANMNMPEAFQKLSIFTPQGWVIKGWQVVLNNQPLTDLLVPLMIMTVIGIVLFTVGAYRFNLRFATE